ncbi:MAG: hypothetical protein KAU23_02705 [Anaerolineales bacterium]|nr:hypothetical protein [Anaerolineales bacterium]
MNRKGLINSAAVLLLLVGISTIAVTDVYANPGELPPPPPPRPSTTPEPPGDGESDDTADNNKSGSVLTQIFKVMFDTSTMKDAIVNSIDSIFNDAVGNLTASSSPFYQMGSEISEIVFETEKLKAVRLASWIQLRKVAFALLPLTAALTIWASMKDGLYSVTGYANTFEAVAEFFVSIAIALASLWLMEQAISLVKILTLAIAESLQVDITGSVYAGMFIKPAALGISNPGLSMILNILSFALVITYMGSVTIAFLAREVVLIMTVALAPVMIILGSVRPLGWLRGLWSKAFIVFLLLLPINVLTMGVAFKFWVSALSLASGPLATILQLTILAGTLSVLIAVNGTLGKLVYGAAIEVAQKVGKTLTSVATMAAGLAVGAVGVGALGGSAFGGSLGGSASTQGLAPVASGGGGAGLALSNSSAGGVVTSTSNLTSTIGRTLSSSRSSAVSSLGRGMRIGAAVKDHKLATQSPPSSPQLNVAENGIPGQSKGMADVMSQIDTPQKAAAIGSDQATLSGRVNLGAQTSAATLEAVEGAGLSAGDYLRDTNYFNPGRPNIEMAGRDFVRSEAGSFALGNKSNYVQTDLPNFTPRTRGLHSLDYQAAQRIVQSEQRVGNNYFSEISAAKMQDVAQAVHARRLSGTHSYEAIVNSARKESNIVDWIKNSKGLIS